MESHYLAYLNRALANFRAAVDARYPRRDKSSDGWIGDEAHQNTSSDHNPDPDGSVDAWDMDVDLRSGNDAAAIEALKDVFEAHPAARYWIHNRQIAHRNSGWSRQPYNGSNPHDKHVHWNSNEATEDSTVPWILGDDLDQATFTQFYLNAIKNDAVEREERARPWQYVGGGIPEGMSTLGVLNELVLTVRDLESKITQPTPVEVDASEVASELASNATFLTALAKAINDDHARRMAA